MIYYKNQLKRPFFFMICLNIRNSVVDLKNKGLQPHEKSDDNQGVEAGNQIIQYNSQSPLDFFRMPDGKGFKYVKKTENEKSGQVMYPGMGDENETQQLSGNLIDYAFTGILLPEVNLCSRGSRDSQQDNDYQGSDSGYQRLNMGINQVEGSGGDQGGPGSRGNRYSAHIEKGCHDYPDFFHCFSPYRNSFWDPVILIFMIS